MAGGQPFSIENLGAVRELTRRHGFRSSSTTRISENALFVKEREPGHGDRSLAEIIRLIADHADGAVFSSKDHFVPIGGFVAVNDVELATRLREEVVVYEGFPHYGGMAGHDLEALAQGSASRPTSASCAPTSHRLHTSPTCSRTRASRSSSPPERTRCSWTRSALPTSTRTSSRTDPRRCLLPRRRRALDGARIVSGQHGAEPYDGLELVRLRFRGGSTREHLTWVANVVAHTLARAPRSRASFHVRTGAPALLPGAVRPAVSVPPPGGGACGGRAGARVRVALSTELSSSAPSSGAGAGRPGTEPSAERSASARRSARSRELAKTTTVDRPVWSSSLEPPSTNAAGTPRSVARSTAGPARGARS